uniref:DUF6339 family protein n=1 Tax=uncultured Allobacillus sp. TaxID=1638025 RepID=UPI00259686A9|nr:DUF6339 family protein [uncultured Allobacillus sp.]
MKLKYISEEALQDLKFNHQAYERHYFEMNDQWFNEYFNQSGYVIESNIEFKMPELNLSQDYIISDQKNVKEIYEALSHLTPVQATQERLWTGLALLQFRDYTFYRLKKDMDNRNERRIKSGLFFTQGNKRSLFIHILARLWWVGYMTYDKNNPENPYWLTDFFSEKDFSARCVTFFSSNFTSNPAITKGILTALIKLQEKGVDIKRDHFQESTKYLNVVGGATILDLLTEKEVEEMITQHLEKIFNNIKKPTLI